MLGLACVKRQAFPQLDTDVAASQWINLTAVLCGKGQCYFVLLSTAPVPAHILLMVLEV